MEVAHRILTVDRVTVAVVAAVAAELLKVAELLELAVQATITALLAHPQAVH